MADVRSPAHQRESRALRRVSSLVLNSPDRPGQRLEPGSGSGNGNSQHNDAKMTKLRQPSEEIIPDSEEERLRCVLFISYP